jgi:DNA-binding NtrC family response regulator
MRINRDAVRAALEAAHGIQERTAKVLGVPRTTLQNWLSPTGPFSDLREFAAKVRADAAPRTQGRPWTTDDNRTRTAVASAWEASGYRLSAAARQLGIPRTSLRYLLHRYELPNLPAHGRAPKRRRR